MRERNTLDLEAKICAVLSLFKELPISSDNHALLILFFADYVCSKLETDRLFREFSWYTGFILRAFKGVIPLWSYANIVDIRDETVRHVIKSVMSSLDSCEPGKLPDSVIKYLVTLKRTLLEMVNSVRNYEIFNILGVSFSNLPEVDIAYGRDLRPGRPILLWIPRKALVSINKIVKELDIPVYDLLNLDELSRLSMSCREIVEGTELSLEEYIKLNDVCALLEESILVLGAWLEYCNDILPEIIKSMRNSSDDYAMLRSKILYIFESLCRESIERLRTDIRNAYRS